MVLFRPIYRFLWFDIPRNKNTSPTTNTHEDVFFLILSEGAQDPSPSLLNTYQTLGTANRWILPRTHPCFGSPDVLEPPYSQCMVSRIFNPTGGGSGERFAMDRTIRNPSGHGHS